jgi:L-alanine-DL-glutamate epimerase-like enolase superfamily enzyme
MRAFYLGVRNVSGEGRIVLKLRVQAERWPLKTPFRIAGHVWSEAETILVTVTRKGQVGKGEAAGVYYLGESPSFLRSQIEDAVAKIETCSSRDALRDILPPGGARNAIDCALWDLEAKEQGVPAWHIAGLAPQRRLPTTITISADPPMEAAEKAHELADAPRLKLKLTGDLDEDVARLRAVRAARPDAWIGVDANQGYARADLEHLYPELVAADVKLIEQPVRRGEEDELDGFSSAIPIAADESVQALDDLPALEGRFQAVNIKLDKSGGLTEALMMAREAKKRGFGLMVGCMAGTSLAMAPAFLLAQLCDVIDLDAPLFQRADRAIPAQYQNGTLFCPEALWGGASAKQERLERL